MTTRTPRERPLIAFFDYSDVFEDFYPHYGVDQRTFATSWADTGNHVWLSLIQREIGDVIWYAFSLAPELSEARHEVVGCTVKMLPSSLLHRHLWRAFYLPRAAWRWRRAYRAYATVASYIALLSWPFVRTLRHDRPDFFFVQSYSSGRFDMLLWIAHTLGIPLIAYHAGGQPAGYLGRVARRWTIRRADQLIVSSHDELDMLASRYRVPQQRATVILTPIDADTFRPIDRTLAYAATRLDPARRYLLFIGRLDDNVKRVGALIRTFAVLAHQYQDVDLLITGDGPDAEDLRRLAADHSPNRVHFLGWISGAEAKAHLYNAADCLVLPSRREGFPTVIGEAMACGTPVLASDVGGVSELIVEGETGWLIAPGDNEALAAGLSFVLANPDLVASMRPRARRIAESRVSSAVVAAQLRERFTAAGEHYG